MGFQPLSWRTCIRRLCKRGMRRDLLCRLKSGGHHLGHTHSSWFYQLTNEWLYRFRVASRRCKTFGPDASLLWHKVVLVGGLVPEGGARVQLNLVLVSDLTFPHIRPGVIILNFQIRPGIHYGVAAGVAHVIHGAERDGFWRHDFLKWRNKEPVFHGRGCGFLITYAVRGTKNPIRSVKISVGGHIVHPWTRWTPVRLLHHPLRDVWMIRHLHPVLVTSLRPWGEGSSTRCQMIAGPNRWPFGTTFFREFAKVLGLFRKWTKEQEEGIKNFRIFSENFSKNWPHGKLIHWPHPFFNSLGQNRSIWNALLMRVVEFVGRRS